MRRPRSVRPGAFHLPYGFADELRVPRTAAGRGRAIVAAVLAIIAVLLSTTLLWFSLSGPPAPPLAAPVDPMYPDLGMAQLSDLLVGQEASGRVFLRFSATLVNIGSGPLLIAAHRSYPFRNDWNVVQQVEDRAGGYSERATTIRLKFAGDGHDHWHVIGAEAHQLETLDGDIVAGLVKSGLLLLRQCRPCDLAAGRPELAGTRHAPMRRAVRPGPHDGPVRWLGDEYQWYLLDQTIEITDVPDGRYRLRAIADPADLFKESNESNNDTWSVVDLTTVDGQRTVKVVEQGPAS